MIKKHKWTLIITSIVTLLPILAGLIIWDQLPEQMATHWNAEGIADGFSSKPVAVFGMPAILLAVHLLCCIVTAADPKRQNLGGKPMALVFWICPMMSLVLGSITYVTALGYNASVEVIIPLVMGFTFVIIGNYLPKCKQNYTVGIKIPWTLNDEENWNKTHRFGGILWVVGGIVIMATSFIGSVWIFLAITLAIAFVPVVYSYIYYVKHKKD